MSDPRLDDLIALAAMGELEPDERAELERVAAGDPAVARALDGALRAAAAFADVTIVRPPAGLRSRVLDSIVDVDQEPHLRSVGQHGAGVASSPSTVPVGARTAPGVSSARGRRPVRWLLAAAAVVAVIGAGSLVVLDRSDSDPIAAVLDADDVQVRPLDGDLDGELVVAYSDDADAYVVSGRAIPEIAATDVYVLWFLPADFTSLDEATAALEFRPDEGGEVGVRVDDVDPGDFVLGVTVETAGSVGSPTEPVLAVSA